MSSFRFRFAPSPTGQLHIGTAKIAILNWVCAQKLGGTLILRVEDSDVSRSDPDFERGIIEDLRWLGIAWREGPDVGGLYGPYRQSERKEIYKRFAFELLRKGLAYRCFCSQEELAQERERMLKSGIPPRYSGRCAGISEEVAERRARAGERFSVRFKTPRADVVFADGVKGEVSVKASAFADFIILRSDGMPTYNFACAVDDGTMGITHVIRGEDHLTNTARQILLLRAMGFDPPKYFHVPLMLNETREKLSKRLGDVSISSLRLAGILAEAIVNYVVSLSWPKCVDREVFRLDEVLPEIDVGRISGTPAVFDVKRLIWLNLQHMKMLSADEVLERLRNVYDVDDMRFGVHILRRGVIAFKDESHTLNELRERLILVADRESARSKFVFFVQKEPENLSRKLIAQAISLALRKMPLNANGPGLLEEVLAYLKELRAEASELGSSANLLQALRVGLIGEVTGPEVARVIYCLGWRESRERLAWALDFLAS